MRDEDFAFFISEFGEAQARREVPEDVIDRWKGRLPEKLLHYWKQEGWCGYADGLFWTVNPDDYEDLVDEWLEGTSLEEVDSFHVIARSGLGLLYLFGEQTGCGVRIDCSLHAIFAHDLKRKSQDEIEQRLPWFFSNLEPKANDLKDANRVPLFKRALTALGPLAEDEMYGFEPALVLGGEMTLGHLRKVKLIQHLMILRQLAPPTIPFGNIDIEKLIASK
ncbi:GAD-like domain protein [Pelomonas sp. HMWF004]|nr:GAD-like domain protein [Pelomonas sp. HMWF004]